MNQSAILKKKGSIPNKAQSPLKNLDADMQYRSSVELVNTFKIKRENVASERNHKAKKEHVPTTIEERIRGFDSTTRKEEELSTSHMIAGKDFQTPPKKGVTASVHVTGTTLGNGEEQHNNQDLLSFKQPLVLIGLPKQQIHKEHDIDHDLPNKKEVKKSPYRLLVLIGQTTRDSHRVDVEYMPAPSIHEHTKGLDDLEGQEEIGEDECDIGEEVDTDCSTKGISKKKKVRGQTTCKHIHARNLEEREEVTFDKGQAVGPTDKIVSELTNFIGTISRNPRFINLMYTSWHACQKILKSLWEYINEKQHGGIEWDQLILQEYAVALRATKENNEEPSQSEMFIATRTKTGKEIQADTKVAIGVFGKEQPADLGAMAIGDNKFSRKR
ncbi:hypothetical protein H5410_047879 [Solanum commersonii]|uniref:Uncharacterized protein n=1 Tax=Solanum commersonii TaxID=4109 RepID=A0A9J5XI83_SOLCO|nr:hypothetical protein H5410_047879 [Solanum commersonii]